MRGTTMLNLLAVLPFLLRDNLLDHFSLYWIMENPEPRQVATSPYPYRKAFQLLPFLKPLPALEPRPLPT